ncbi:hypothetical protein [Mesorhizobium sp. Pch-S]|uniref:hypothetical protein n=1 Tax=Mesorhizobium sp. Pch-S TaxID=2082387 RepID=UPI0010134878|nr:hypothetical protein [Mesorhizobium sp. Pch-S]
MTWDREMMAALEVDGDKLRQLTGEDHGPHPMDGFPYCGDLSPSQCEEIPCPWKASTSAEHSYPGQAPCPHCYESSGYVWEHGNDWNTGPWSTQTNIRCSHCDGPARSIAHW